jgi:hypothetical protein
VKRFLWEADVCDFETEPVEEILCGAHGSVLGVFLDLQSLRRVHAKLILEFINDKSIYL